MKWTIRWLVYFFTGVFVEFLTTIYTRSVSDSKIFLAVTTSFAITFLSFLIFYSILEKMNKTKRKVLAIFIYCLGVAAGTTIGMLFRI